MLKSEAFERFFTEWGQAFEVGLISDSQVWMDIMV